MFFLEKLISKTQYLFYRLILKILADNIILHLFLEHHSLPLCVPRLSYEVSYFKCDQSSDLHILFIKDQLFRGICDLNHSNNLSS